MSLRAAARWVLSQSFVCIHVQAADILAAMYEAGAVQIDHVDDSKLTYLNLCGLDFGRRTATARLFDSPILSLDVLGSQNVGMEVLDECGKSLGLVKEDVGAMLRVESGEIRMKSDVKLCLKREARDKVFHRFQRIAYLNKTFGRGIRGDIFGRVRRRKKKGVRKDPAACSHIHPRRPKNAEACRSPAEIRECQRNAHDTSVAARRHGRKILKQNLHVCRLQSRDHKYRTCVAPVSDDAWEQLAKQSDGLVPQGWETQWLVSWAVEEDLEHWHRHVMLMHQHRHRNRFSHSISSLSA
jgi:hypothetical protein